MAEKCLNLARNQKRCSCSYEPCSRKGFCCECLQYHLKMKELPACFFPADAEASFNRSFENFISIYKRG